MKTIAFLLLAFLVSSCASPPRFNREVVGYQVQARQEARQKDYPAAIASCTRAIEADPNNPSHYNMRAVYKDRLKDRQGAIADLDTAIRLYEPLPANRKWVIASACNLRGTLKKITGDVAGADADFKLAQYYKEKYKSYIAACDASLSSGTPGQTGIPSPGFGFTPAPTVNTFTAPPSIHYIGVGGGTSVIDAGLMTSMGRR